ncbi:MAG: phosphoribosyltransferase [Steroidobacteraceae bacterium]
MHFKDRSAAGYALATRLTEYQGLPDVVVLGLPRGGVPVAFEVAQVLRAPLDVLIVRKIGAPGQPEFALGAIASGGVFVLNDDVPASLVDTAEVASTVEAERRELERRDRLYRAGKTPLALAAKRLVLVDDGAATGSSMLAAVRAARQLGAGQVIVALPVASPDAAHKLSREADRVVCLGTPASFVAVGQWYEDFPQVTDAEVRALLRTPQGGP